MTLELLKYNKVIFYGAGDIAQMLYGELLKRRVNIDACVVTDIEKNGKSFLGKVPGRVRFDVAGKRDNNINSRD